jgi:hypothetical protein
MIKQLKKANEIFQLSVWVAILFLAGLFVVINLQDPNLIFDLIFNGKG